MVPFLQVLCVAGSLSASALKFPVDGDRPEQFSIIMADTRNAFPDVPTVSMKKLSWFEISAMINFKYAQTHGYKFALYKLPEGDCKHVARNVSRHPAWCKLLGLVQSKRDHGSNVHRVYLDSDMHIEKSTMGISMQELMGAVIPRKTAGKECKVCSPTDAECLKIPQAWGAMLPMGGESMLGAMVIQRPGAHGDTVLQEVWNKKHHDTEFPWEQAAWNDVFESQDGRSSVVVGITALQDREWIGHGWPEKCGQFDDGIKLDSFTAHLCHFQDDNFLMGSDHDDENRAARDRLREDLGCGPDWEHKCTDNISYREAIERHNFYKGNRKLIYAQALQDMADTQEIARLYQAVRERMKELPAEQLQGLASELEGGATFDRQSPDREGFLRRHPDYGAEVEREMRRASGYGQGPPIKDKRATPCWCDGP